MRPERVVKHIPLPEKRDIVILDRTPEEPAEAVKLPRSAHLAKMSAVELAEALAEQAIRTGCSLRNEDDALASG